MKTIYFNLFIVLLLSISHCTVTNAVVDDDLSGRIYEIETY